jgi:hypothetical protein
MMLPEYSRAFESAGLHLLETLKKANAQKTGTWTPGMNQAAGCA